MTVTLTPGRAVDGLNVIDGDLPALATADMGGAAVPVLAEGYAVDAGVDVARFDADAVATDEVGVVVGLELGPPVPPVVLVGVKLRLCGVPVGRDDADDVAVGEGSIVGVAVALVVAVLPLVTEVAVPVLIVAVRVAALVAAGLAVAVLVADGSAGSVAGGSAGSVAGGVAVPPIVLPPEPFASR